MMIYHVLLWFFTTMIPPSYMILMPHFNANKTVLVFGGTGNIGTEVVHHLLEHNYQPTLVSRGNWHYDSARLIKQRVTHISCDRYKKPIISISTNILSHCSELMDFIKRHTYFDFVIDISAFSSKAVKHAAEVLKGKVGLYIYISSDSVYEVCRKPKEVPIKETESVRPEDKRERRRLANEDKYGDGKLKVEEFLAKQRASGGFPYMTLRLPDVIGPRDTTMRWWQLQTHIKFYHIIEAPIIINEDARDLTSSLVFTKDIAKAILSAMEAGETVHDQVYNIGFDKSFHYKDIVESIAKELNIEGIEFEEEEGYSLQVYPSVTIGPVDTSKIKRHLGFTPTPWEHAVNETVAWYEKAPPQLNSYLDSVANDLVDNIVPKENKKAFIEALQKSRIRDEL